MCCDLTWRRLLHGLDGGELCFALQAITKTKTNDTVQMVIVLVFNESANIKIALYTYLRLTLNGNYVGWAKVREQREYSTAHGYLQSHQSLCWSNNKAKVT